MNNHASQRLGRRRVEPSHVLLIAPLAGVIGLVVYLVVEAMVPGVFTAPRPETLPEAILQENAPGTLDFVLQGFSVDRPARVRAGIFDDREYVMTPIEAAIVVRRLEIVRLLMRAGASVRTSPRAECLARVRLPEALAALGLPVAKPLDADFGECFLTQAR